MSGHAILSPSSSEAWLRAGCTGYPALNYGKDDLNEFAAEGTAAHAMLEWCLTTVKPAVEFPFPVIHVLENGTAHYGEDRGDPLPIAYSFDADDEMREHVQTVVDDILRHAKGNEIIAEQRVSFSASLGIDEKAPDGTDLASGTADARVMDYDERQLQVHDLKYGRSPRGIVYAGTEDDPNPQLALYGVGALEEAELLGDWDTVALHIHQPRLDHKDSVVVPVEKMRAFIQSARARAAEAMAGFDIDENGNRVPKPMEELDELGMLQPSDKGCHYCAVRDICPARKRKARQAILDNYDVIEPELPEGTTVEKVTAAFNRGYPLPADLNMLESFVEAWRERIYRELKQGKQRAGWKLVKGKKGARQWVKAKLGELEKLLKDKFRLPVDTIYSKKLRSPKQLEDALKESPKRWEQIANGGFYSQAEGGEALVPEEDPRPALKIADIRDQFEDLEDNDLV